MKSDRERHIPILYDLIYMWTLGKKNQRQKDGTEVTDTEEILEETNDCQRQWLKCVKRPKATNFQL